MGKRLSGAPSVTHIMILVGMRRADPNLCLLLSAFQESFPVMAHPESTEEPGPGAI